MHIPNSAGWLPKSDVMKSWYQHQIKQLPQFNRPWNDVITEFKDLIETNPDIYMGFSMMFEETKEHYDPRGEPQVCYIFLVLHRPMTNSSFVKRSRTT
jgi:phosphatidylserine decarboxylase